MYRILRPILFRMEPERAHDLIMSAAQRLQSIHPRILRPFFQFEHPILEQMIWGLHFSNPVGLAAGADKNARLLRLWESIGFGFVEVGSVTHHPSEGNPRPRSFRLPSDYALINRMGLNNDGAERISKRIKAARAEYTLPLGINIAKTHNPAILGYAALEDFRFSFSRLAPVADYIALNISCPNTEEGKTFEEPDALANLLQVIVEERDRLFRPVPLLVKLSPPETEAFSGDSQTDEVINVLKSYQVDGLIAINTAADRQGLISDPALIRRIGRGGLSGAPIEGRATEVIRYLYRRTEGRIPIIGLGGISSAVGAYMKIRAGASLLQLYTAMIYEGPSLIRQIKKDLVDLLQRDGFSNITEAVGVDT